MKVLLILIAAFLLMFYPWDRWYMILLFIALIPITGIAAMAGEIMSEKLVAKYDNFFKRMEEDRERKYREKRMKKIRARKNAQ